MNALSVRVISFAIAPNWLRIQRQVSVAPFGPRRHRVGGLEHQPQIPAGAEGRVAAGEDDRPDHSVRTSALGAVELERQGRAQRIELLRVVERDGRVGSLALHGYERTILLASPRSAPLPRSLSYMWSPVSLPAATCGSGSRILFYCSILCDLCSLRCRAAANLALPWRRLPTISQTPSCWRPPGTSSRSSTVKASKAWNASSARQWNGRRSSPTVTRARSASWIPPDSRTRCGRWPRSKILLGGPRRTLRCGSRPTRPTRPRRAAPANAGACDGDPDQAPVL